MVGVAAVAFSITGGHAGDCCCGFVMGVVVICLWNRSFIFKFVIAREVGQMPKLSVSWGVIAVFGRFNWILEMDVLRGFILCQL